MNKLYSEQIAHIKQHIKDTIKKKTLSLIKGGVNKTSTIDTELFNQYAIELNFSDFNISIEADLWIKAKINLSMLADSARAKLKKDGLICFNKQKIRWVVL